MKTGFANKNVLGQRDLFMQPAGHIESVINASTLMIGKIKACPNKKNNNQFRIEWDVSIAMSPLPDAFNYNELRHYIGADAKSLLLVAIERFTLEHSSSNLELSRTNSQDSRNSMRDVQRGTPTVPSSTIPQIASPNASASSTSRIPTNNDNNTAAQAAARFQTSPTLPPSTSSASRPWTRSSSTDVDSDSDEEIDDNNLSEDAVYMHLHSNDDSDDDNHEEDDNDAHDENNTPLSELIDSILWDFEEIDKDTFMYEQDHLYDKPGGLK